MGMTDRHERFTALFPELYPPVLRFVTRRVGPGAADDITSEVFAVLWRRFDDMPSDAGEQRAWVFGIARRLILAQQRKDLRDPLPTLVDDSQLSHEDSVVELSVLLHAWRCLSDAQRETIALTAWDGLTSSEAASVLGISAVAYRIRLSRARSALSTLLERSGRTAPASSISHTRSVS